MEYKYKGYEEFSPMHCSIRNAANCKTVGCSKCVIDGGSFDKRNDAFPGITMVNCENVIILINNQMEWKKHHVFINIKNRTFDAEPLATLIISKDEPYGEYV